MKRIALAYSGGLDTSVIIPWLLESYDCEVIAVTGDVGQGDEELEGIEAKAKQSGAAACYVTDLKEEFIEEFAFPTLLTGAIYEGRYLLGTAIARPVLAKAQVEVALRVGADALCHGCTGKGNDQVRFESAFAALAPHLEVIAPWRTWSLRSREDLIEYLRSRGIPCSASLEKIYSRDANLWHISHEGGELEDVWNPPPADIWMRTAPVANTPERPQVICIGFEQGRPRTIDGHAMDGPALVSHLNTVAGRHGVGRVDLVENRLVGMKSRGCYETPAGTVLSEALAALKELVLDRDTLHMSQKLALDFAELVYNGRWFTPLRNAIGAFFESLAPKLTGEVAVELHKGTATAVQRRAGTSLYAEDFATFGADDVYSHSHAEGFIRLYTLPQRIAALKHSSPSPAEVAS